MASLAEIRPDILRSKVDVLRRKFREWRGYDGDDPIRHLEWTAVQLNISELAGASTAVAISNAYYPDNRNASDAATRLGVQLSADIVGNVLKEFSPEISRLLSKKHGKKTR